MSVASCGVLEYEQADGSPRRELVLPEELHRAAGHFIPGQTSVEFISPIAGDIAAQRIWR